MGKIVLCHSVPLFHLWALQAEAVGFDKGAVISVRMTEIEQNQGVFMAEYDSFII